MEALLLLAMAACLFLGGGVLFWGLSVWWTAGFLPVAAFAAPTLVWAWKRGVVHFVIPSKRLAFADFLAAAALAVGGSILALAVAGLLSRLPASSGEEELLRNVVLGPPLLTRFILFAGVPALCEELLFRGGVLACLRRWPPMAACVASGMVFALFHGSLLRFLPIAIIGTALAAVVLRTGNIWLAVLGHALHNSLVLVLISEGGGAGAVEQVPYWMTAAMAATGILLLTFGWKKRVNSGRSLNQF